jgi:hypothetical protein
MASKQLTQQHIKVLGEFRTNLVSFLDELIEQFPAEGDLVAARIFLADQVPILDIMNTFIRRVIPIKEMAKLRDDKFFLENEVLFSQASTSKISYFKELWTSKILDDDDRQTIWKWFDLFIGIAEKYIKLN